MSINCGIVGLPNVGKSTIFSALTSVKAEAANYPFCTIEPNVGLVEVPDIRLNEIAKIYNPKKVIPAAMEFVDIAGLVKGASQGEGLGNKFLSHIRETGITAHVVRCFEDDNITHVSGKIDPKSDIETIVTELALADLATVQRRKDKLGQEKKARNPETARILPILEPMLNDLEKILDEGNPARVLATSNTWSEEEEAVLNSLHLITQKPMIYVCNVSEDDVKGNDYTKLVAEHAQKEGSDIIIICGALESEIAQLEKEERSIFLQEAGLEYSGLDALIRSAYHVLGLRTYFTAGEQEVRAWTFKDGALAPEAAGIIHSDFQRGFIRAETFSYDDLCSYKSESAVRSAGKLRTEGKEYLVQDGDIMHFKFNV